MTEHELRELVAAVTSTLLGRIQDLEDKVRELEETKQDCHTTEFGTHTCCCYKD